MELFKNLSKTFITHIPYRGAGPVLNDTVAGQVPIIFDNMPSALPFIKDGRLIPIVVAAPNRLSQAAQRADLQGSRVGAGQPHGLRRHPRAEEPAQGSGRQDPRGGEARRSSCPKVRARIEGTGSLVVANTPAEFAAQTAAEFEVYKKVVAAQKLKLE